MGNEEILYRISEYIHREKDRRILRRKLVDGITYEALAEEVDMSVRGVQQVVYRNREAIFGQK
jgi:hypothetical protein